ncbi:MAG: hypothetical protein BWY65_02240 [Firmicutes bacterium ADurb.Bin373]|nr:MAG: hypothetical protein BWY65_02240 [Firmicutes bacterium ADurb.Bin373]
MGILQGWVFGNRISVHLVCPLFRVVLAVGKTCKQAVAETIFRVYYEGSVGIVQDVIIEIQAVLYSIVHDAVEERDISAGAQRRVNISFGCRFSKPGISHYYLGAPGTNGNT